MIILKHLKRSRGFTLIEVLIASSISIITISMIYMIFAAGNDLWETKRYQADLQAQGRLAMNRMVAELRQTTRTSAQNPSPDLKIPSKPNNKDVSFYLPIDKDGNGLITDVDGNIEWETNNKIQYHYIPGQKQLVRLEKGDKTTLANDVSDVQFIDNSIDGKLYLNEVKIVLTLFITTPRQRTISMTFTSVVKVRN